MLDEGMTIPFIARYKKDETGNLSDVLLRKFEEEKETLTKLIERKETVLKSIESQGKLTAELQKSIEDARSLSLLETLYRPYRPKRKTRGSVAKEKGLLPLAIYLKAQRGNLSDLHAKAATFINPDEGIENETIAIQMALDILAEEISDSPSYYLDAKRYIWRTGHLVAKESKEDVDKHYANYAHFDTPLTRVKAHQTLAILRGAKEKKVHFSFVYDAMTITNAIARDYLLRPKSPFEDLLRGMIADAYKRLLAPAVETEITNELFAKAQDFSLDIFAKNLKQLLLASPTKGKKILGFDPGYRNGCKLALIDPNGQVLKTAIIYPTIGKQKEAEALLDVWLRDSGFDLIALGNGTASHESRAFLQGYLENRNLEEQIKISVVNESGASVYSASPLANKEFPDMDIEERSAVSLARRLLDPMAELVKIPPEAIGVGQYQHNMDENKLKQTLENATVDAVNKVGVWLNTASFSLLRYVSGINGKLAEAIVDYRDEHGPFRYRKDLLNVKGFGPKTFLDAAGFLRIENDNPLERTAVHPKDYVATTALCRELGINQEEIGTEKALRILETTRDYDALARRTGLGEYALKDIIDELKKPGRDPRDNFKAEATNDNIKDLSDLEVGMILHGVVRNLSAFGAFVDISAHQDGLVHLSEISNRYITDPSEVLSIGENVRVKVIGIDLERKRISLSIKRISEDD